MALLARNGLEWALVDFALARIGAVGIPVYASSSPKDVGYLLAHSEAVAVVCEDAEQLAKVEAVTDDLPSLRARPHLSRPRRTRGARRRLRGREPGGARRGDGGRDRRRPLHDHLHVRDDRAAEGLHALEPQLLRDGHRRRPDGDDLLPARRRHASLPPARAQLRAVDALARGARGVHDRVPRRSARGSPKRCRRSGRPCSRASRACTRRSTPPSSPDSTPPRG